MCKHTNEHGQTTLVLHACRDPYFFILFLPESYESSLYCNLHTFSATSILGLASLLLVYKVFGQSCTPSRADKMGGKRLSSLKCNN